jgi:hypothetical protein
VSSSVPAVVVVIAFVSYAIAIYIAAAKGHGVRGLYWVGAFELAKPGTRWYYRYGPVKRLRSDTRWPVDAAVAHERDAEILDSWHDEDVDESKLDAITRRALRKARKR